MPNSRGSDARRQATADRGIRKGVSVVFDGMLREGPFRVKLVHEVTGAVELEGRVGMYNSRDLVVVPLELREPAVSADDLEVDGSVYGVEFSHHITTGLDSFCGKCQINPSQAHLVLEIISIQEEAGASVDPDTRLGRRIRTKLQTGLRRNQRCDECTQSTEGEE